MFNVDQFADQEMAVNIIKNAKTQRIGVCNACESIVVHRAIAKRVSSKAVCSIKRIWMWRCAVIPMPSNVWDRISHW